MQKQKWKITIQDITTIGLMVAVIEVCKALFTYLPNIELTSFWLILFTIYFGWKIIFVIPVFILIECAIYPLGVWIIMYLYVWPLLALLAWIFRKQESIWFWSLLSGGFGLCYGFLCSFTYIVTGTTQNGLAGGLATAFAWWIAGIPWDIVHGVANFVVMMVLYKPVRNVMKKVSILTV